jgi:DNA adenine methylase
VRPLIRWAGGKTKLLPEILARVPKKYGTYCEPFVGGGAVFAALRPARAVISDLNGELINLYRVVRSAPSDLDWCLSMMDVSRDEFMRVRGLDRTDVELDELQRAVRFLYLNKTCFNGLWRVNLKGQANMPYGSPNPGPLDVGVDIWRWYRLLRDVDIRHAGFDEVLDTLEEGDFAYLDPPYLGTYDQYDAERFGEQEHVYLKKYCDKVTKRGVKLLLSLSDTPQMRELYSKYTVDTVVTRHTVGAKGAWRPKTTELLVRNYAV